MPIAHYAYTALDCPNPWRLADFYSQITDWRVQPFEEGETEETCEWLELLAASWRLAQEPTRTLVRILCYSPLPPKTPHIDTSADPASHPSSVSHAE